MFHPIDLYNSYRHAVCSMFEPSTMFQIRNDIILDIRFHLLQNLSHCTESRNVTNCQHNCEAIPELIKSSQFVLQASDFFPTIKTHKASDLSRDSFFQKVP